MIEQPLSPPNPSLAQALESGRLVAGPATSPRWVSLPPGPKSVGRARRFAVSQLADVVEADAEHVDDVVLVVSELITNAVREVAKLSPSHRDKPVRLGIVVGSRWTYLLSVDSAPALPKEMHSAPLAGSGRGIPIIRSLAARTWVEQGANDKTIHVVMTRTGMRLTPEEIQALGLGSAS